MALREAINLRLAAHFLSATQALGRATRQLQQFCSRYAPYQATAARTPP